MDPKSLVSSMHKALKEKGHKVPIGHIYEALAKATGHDSWNVASQRDLKLSQLQPEVVAVRPTDVSTPNLGGGYYEVKVVNENDGIEIKKYYHVNAGSEQEAEQVVESYIRYRCEEDESPLSHPEVARLARVEDESDFVYRNWEVIENRYQPEVQKGSTYKIR